jgi:hypothetical protein
MYQPHHFLLPHASYLSNVKSRYFPVAGISFSLSNDAVTGMPVLTFVRREKLSENTKVKGYARYPKSSVLVYEADTIYSFYCYRACHGGIAFVPFLCGLQQNSGYSLCGEEVVSER